MSDFASMGSSLFFFLEISIIFSPELSPEADVRTLDVEISGQVLY
jgi:hypothetical protein